MLEGIWGKARSEIILSVTGELVDEIYTVWLSGSIKATLYVCSFIKILGSFFKHNLLCWVPDWNVMVFCCALIKLAWSSECRASC